MPTSWTTPITWVASAPTVSQFNQQIRDNLTHVYEAKGNVRAVATKTGNYTATADDGLLLCNGTLTVTLPSAATVGAGFVYQIKNIGTGTVTIDPDGAQTVDGQSTIAIPNQYWSLTICSDGSNWHIL